MLQHKQWLEGETMFVDEIAGASWKATEEHQPSQERVDAVIELMKTGQQVQIFAGEKAHTPPARAQFESEPVIYQPRDVIDSPLEG